MHDHIPFAYVKLFLYLKMHFFGHWECHLRLPPTARWVSTMIVHTASMGGKSSLLSSAHPAAALLCSTEGVQCAGCEAPVPAPRKRDRSVPPSASVYPAAEGGRESRANRKPPGLIFIPETEAFCSELQIARSRVPSCS